MPAGNGSVGLRHTSHGYEDDRKLGELFADLSRDVSTLVRQEVQLAKTELRDEVSKAGKAGGMLGGAALMGLYCLLLLAFAAAWGLSEVVPEGVAFLIVGVVFGIVAAVLFVVGRAKLRQVRPVPNETVETLKEDVQWAKAQVK
jgi:Putative Actinobacterial Holin-X, holin superfamily III